VNNLQVPATPRGDGSKLHDVWVSNSHPVKHGRIGQLDGVRALAFLSVFVHHALHVPLLWFGVDLFFVLSGFLITRILVDLKGGSIRAAIAHFYERRARRILPPLLCTFLLVSLLFAPDWGRIWPWYAFCAANFGEALGRIGVPALQSIWSLAVEEQFYLVWPLVVLTLGRSSLYKALAGIIVGAPILRAIMTVSSHGHFFVYMLTPFRMDLLAAGGCLGMLYNEGYLSRPGAKKVMVIAVCLSIALFGVLATTIPSFRTGSNSILFNTAGYSLILICFTALLGLSLELASDTLAFRFLTCRTLTYLGTISYTMYLVHQSMILDH
jgi:peptidoglycan/LPS O-acetylase OafA/YrhL